jgi:1,2-dihydroxy-3-keto-5-methylthiopentene dioxygenase
MSTLSIYREDGSVVKPSITDRTEIADTLTEVGVQFENWPANHPLAPDADQQSVLDAYQESIARLNRQYGFRSVDVVSLGPDHPNKHEMRQKFLNEHTHADFEIRFFIEGRGLFYLHFGERVVLVLCEQGDLISVPANTTHWFDMGTRPNFKCIRFFTTEGGWEGSFTGSTISERFPSFDEYASRA